MFFPRAEVDPMSKAAATKNALAASMGGGSSNMICLVVSQYQFSNHCHSVWCCDALQHTHKLFQLERSVTNWRLITCKTAPHTHTLLGGEEKNKAANKYTTSTTQMRKTCLWSTEEYIVLELQGKSWALKRAALTEGPPLGRSLFFKTAQVCSLPLLAFFLTPPLHNK